MDLIIGGKFLSIQKIQMIFTVQQQLKILMKIFNEIQRITKQTCYKNSLSLYLTDKTELKLNFNILHLQIFLGLID